MGIDPVSLAITVALNAAVMGMNAMRKIEGPRITDLSVSTADYGTPLNYVLGISRVAGAMGDQPGGLGLSRSASVALTGGAAVSSAVRFDGFPEPWRVDAVLEDLRFQDAEKPEELAVYLSTTQASALKVRLPSMQLLFSCVGRCDADVVRRLGEAVAPHADVVAPAVALTSLYEAAARPTR